MKKGRRNSIRKQPLFNFHNRLRIQKKFDFNLICNSASTNREIANGHVRREEPVEFHENQNIRFPPLFTPIRTESNRALEIIDRRKSFWLFERSTIVLRVKANISRCAIEWCFFYIHHSFVCSLSCSSPIAHLAILARFGMNR